MIVVTPADVEARYYDAMASLTEDQKWAVAMLSAIEFEHRDIDYLYEDINDAWEAAQQTVFSVEAENQSQNA